MKRYEYQVSFFLNKEQNKAFTEYCISKNVAPYTAGRDIVRDFMMSKKDEIEQTLISNSLEEEFKVMKNDVEMLVTALGVQVEKCEKLEEAISSLQEEIDWRGIDHRVESLEEDVTNLINDVETLEQSVLSEAS